MLELRFNDGKSHEITSYKLKLGDLLISLYGKSFEQTKDLFVDADKSHITITDTETGEIQKFDNYIDVVSMTSMITPQMKEMYIQVKLAELVTPEE